MKKGKSNVGIIMFLLAVIIILLVVIVVLFVNLINIKDNEKYQNSENDNKKVDNVLNKDEIQNESNEDILNVFVGEWGMCDENNGCYGVIIAKDDKNSYTYNPYFMWSDGGNIGTINSVVKIDDNKYELMIYFPERESAGSFYEESNEKIIISKNNDDIEINNIRYQKITIDREEFFQSLIK